MRRAAVRNIATTTSSSVSASRAAARTASASTSISRSTAAATSAVRFAKYRYTVAREHPASRATSSMVVLATPKRLSDVIVASRIRASISSVGCSRRSMVVTGMDLRQ